MKRATKNSTGGKVETQLDSTDSKILTILQSNGRESYREIARRLGVSEGTVRGRANRLQSEGVLTIAAIADPFKLGYRAMAFCLLNVQLGEQTAAIDELTEWVEVTYISSCTGRADLYIQIVCRDHEHLWQLLVEQLPKVTGVTAVETFQETKMHKLSYMYPEFGPSAPT
ncbi:Lrp/AsnC family transcriptional regulator [Arthrobacter castelli]|uniref:Lrp/AsnC family transcriptional regulator n=1 Tax=Arthrobacter castelli TaxID=271431 RepID=UPI00047A7362|nr:Lrp/AsnC family transcriptional regulator [Arthrobacter castelli]